MKATLENGETIEIPLEPDEYLADAILVARVEKLEEPGKDRVLVGTTKHLGVVKATGMLTIALEYQSIFNEDEGD